MTPAKCFSISTCLDDENRNEGNQLLCIAIGLTFGLGAQCPAQWSGPQGSHL